MGILKKGRSYEGCRSRLVDPKFLTQGLNGFTLLEVMVAVAITAFVLVSLIGLSNSSTRDVLFAEHMTTATFLAKRIVSEAMIEKSFKSIEEEGGFEEEQFKDYSWKKTVTISEPIEGVQVTELRVAVLWKEGERQESVELVAYE